MKILIGGWLGTMFIQFLGILFFSTAGYSQTLKPAVATVSFGNHTKIVAPPSRKEKIRKFYGEVLGCTITKQTDRIDIFKMGDFFLGVVYTDLVATDDELLKSIWLEIKTDNIDAVKNRIIDFGVKQIESPVDKEHFIFQAPDGQVYRLVDSKEDMSRYEK